MRILHLIHSFPPESHGGTECYVRDLALAQKSRGDEVVVAAGSERADRSASHEREEHAGLPVWRLRPPARGFPSLVGVDAGVRASLEAILERERPQLVHLHHWHNLTSDAVATCRSRGARVVVTLHDLWISCPLFFRLPDGRNLCPPQLPLEDCVRCIGRLVGNAPSDIAENFGRRIATIGHELEQAGAVIALSKPQQEFLANVPTLRSVPMRMVPMPAPQMPPPRRIPERGHPHGRLRIATWGGLDRGKGLLQIVEAVELLPDSHSVSIRHYGRILDEGYRAEVERAARDLDLELHGSFTPDDLVQASVDCDLAVFASLYLETYGFVVDEALLLGMPVLVSDRGAPKERLGGRGRVFEAGDPVALTALLEECRNGTLFEELERGRMPQLRSMPEHLAELDAVYRAALA
jgi:glycosyltransferase involved in cell wall biosynthesis